MSLFCLITWLPQPKAVTGTRALTEPKWQISYFCEDVKGYLRGDMTFSLGRMKNKFNFFPLTFMNPNFSFVCGDRFLYFSQRKTQFSLSKEKQKRMQVQILWLFQYFKGPLSKEGTWWIHPHSCPSQELLYLQGRQEEKRNINTLLVNTALFDFILRTQFTNKKNFSFSWRNIGQLKDEVFHEIKDS